MTAMTASPRRPSSPGRWTRARGRSGTARAAPTASVVAAMVVTVGSARPSVGQARRSPCRAPTLASVSTDPSTTPPVEVPAELQRLRSSIDNIDAALVHLLAERFKATQRVGVLKAERGLPPADPSREERQIARLRSLADDAGLDPTFAEKFLTFVIAEVIRHHEAIAGEGGDRGTDPAPAIFHLALPEDWARAREVGEYRVSTRGMTLEEVGFIHASGPHQWQGVRRRFYADVDGPLLLLTIDTARLEAEVVREPGVPGGDELFPHVYGPIPVDAVTEVATIEPPH